MTSEGSFPLTAVAMHDNHEEEREDIPEYPLRSSPIISRRKKRAFGHFQEDETVDPKTMDATAAPMMLPNAAQESMNSSPQNRKESLFASSPALNWSDDDEEGDDVFDEKGGTWLPLSNEPLALVVPASPDEAVKDDSTELHHHVTEPEDEDNGENPDTDARSVTSSDSVDKSKEMPEPPKEEVEGVAVEMAEPPDWDDVLASTEALFHAVPDPTTVTVQDILQSLAAEYDADYIFSKTVKKQVRTRLVELMQQQQQVQQQKEEEEEEDPEEENQANVVGDSDIGDDEEESVAANESEEEYPTDDDREEDDDEEYEQNRHRKSKKKKSRSQAKKDATRSSLRPKKNKASSTQLALRVHAEQRRKRRLEELKVRNEELALHQSAVDRERAEQIAAQFQTQTDELRRQRLEQRLDLGHKLNQARLRAVVLDTLAIKKEVAVSELPPKEEKVDTTPNHSESEDSDDELEIEGHPSMPPPPASLANRNPPPSQRPKDALSLLLEGSSSQPRRRMAAPDPRAALRQCLQERQRSMGNRWLARELGYPTEEEHIQVCLAEEQVKRERILQREQARIQADQERSARLLNDEVEEELEETEETEMPDTVDEEDEEMAMARDLEGDDETEEGAFPIVDSAGTGSVLNSQAISSHAEITLDASEMEHSFTAVTNRSEPLVLDRSLSVIETPSSPKAIATQDEINDNDAAESLLASGDATTLSMDDASEAASTEPVDDAPDKTSKAPSGSPEDTTISADALETSNDLVDDDDDDNAETSKEFNSRNDKPKGPRNSAWQAILKQDAEKAKKKKRSQLIEEEADEEEEEEVAGLEDFGFVVHKKKKDDDEDDDIVDFDEDDLKHVVDDLSDDEGDELAGTKARKAMEAQEEKERHKEMLRRMRDGYDGRRGGIAGSGAGARGVHRFDQLVAAENREDAKLLGLLNDDEIDSENEEEGEKAPGDNEEDDEHVLLDKMLKARFLHRSSVEEEVFSDDDDAEDADESPEQGIVSKEDEEEKEQERLAKRFAKRARMQRLIELHGHEAEFSQSKLIDEDVDLKLELQNMKNGLTRKRSDLSSNSSQVISIGSNASGNKKQKLANPTFATSLLSKGGSLAIALQTNRRSNKTRTTFVQRGACGSTSEVSSSFQKCIAFNHVVFHSANSKGSQLSTKSNHGHSQSSMSQGFGKGATKDAAKASFKNSDSLFAKLALGGYSNGKKR